MISKSLIEKYNRPLPRYTSYPPANYFNKETDSRWYESVLKESNENQPENISIYLHIPFCKQLCHFCGCNTNLMQDESLVRDYINALKKEITKSSQFIRSSRKVSQVHFGGGTPNAIPLNYLEELLNHISSLFPYTEDAEIAIECNPAYLSDKDVDDLAKMGFNRVSLGIQDIHENVLATINRKPSALPLSELMKAFRRHRQINVNLDFVYGLPLQNQAVFSENIDKALELRPDRMVTFSYAHVPWVKPAQKHLEKFGFPTPDEKMEMYFSAYKRMTEAGYQFIGLDHFALPGDELAVALSNRTLHRNFQGYCTREKTGQVYAFGVTGISQLTNAYTQNTSNLTEYIEKINHDEFALKKAYRLSIREIMIREMINEIMCNKYLDLSKIKAKYPSERGTIYDILEKNREDLQELLDDQLMNIEFDIVEISEKGGFFLRNIAAVFDPNLKDLQKKFSKTV